MGRVPVLVGVLQLLAELRVVNAVPRCHVLPAEVVILLPVPVATSEGERYPVEY